MSKQKPSNTRVRALYRDSTVLFDMPARTTMGELAAVLAAFGRGHGAPLEVEVALPRLPRG
jgi:hypothetical protein